jgi:hypothetical protein
VRDLTVDGRLVARWVPVSDGEASVIENGTRIKLAWLSADSVTGLVYRRRGSSASVRFFAEHEAGSSLRRTR